MPKLAIHSTTARQLELFKSSPVHALALVGLLGAGKAALAQQLIADLLNIQPDKLENYPYLSTIEPDGNNISIEAIRELANFLKLTTTGKDALRRFVIVEHAGSLSLEAQNALLKLLEEPADSLIILTLENEQDVLPTILSRLRVIRIHTPNKDRLRDTFEDLSEQAFEQSYSLSAGLPGLMWALNNQAEDDHPFITAVATAKQILQSKTFERLQLVDSLSKQKEGLGSLLQALKRISDTSLAQAANKEDYKSLKRWQKVLKATYQAELSLLKGAQAKLALTNLMLSL